MTLIELNERIVGQNERDNEFWRRMAQLFAYVLTAQTGKRQKARNLLPEVFDTPPVYTAEEKQQELDEIKESVGLN